MWRLVVLVVVLSLVIIQPGLCLRCYGCQGYDPRRPQHPTNNNPACRDNNNNNNNHFYKEAIRVYTHHGPSLACYSLTYFTGYRWLTVRYMTHLHEFHGRKSLSRSGPESRALSRWGNTFEHHWNNPPQVTYGGVHVTWVKGYYCYTDLCNGGRAILASDINLILSVLLFGCALYSY